MIKKLLIISLLVFGLVGGISISSAQNINSVPSATSIISSADIDALTIADANLQLGMKNLNVRKMQEILKAKGYFPSNLETTENFGPKTRDAIINFQKANGIPATGFFGPATRAALKKDVRGSGAVINNSTTTIACVKTAIEKRENALLSAYDIFAGKLRTSRETRKTDLLIAWSIQDSNARNIAVKTAWDKNKKSVKIATIEWNQIRKTIWAQFAQDAKVCKASVVEIETQDLEKAEVIAE
ncbi:MAG: peptidoglycan-binding domain-containing protein [bacterium]